MLTFASSVLLDGAPDFFLNAFQVFFFFMLFLMSMLLNFISLWKE